MVESIAYSPYFKIGNEFRINTHLLGSQGNPDVAAVKFEEGEGFIVTWSSADQDLDNSNGVYGQRFFLNGTKIGEEFIVNTYYEGVQSSASVCSIKSGFVVIWSGNEYNQTNCGPSGCSLGIYGQCFDSSGIKDGEEFHVNTIVNGSQKYPKVHQLSSGGFVVVWEWYLHHITVHGIYGQIYDENCNKVVEEFKISEMYEEIMYERSPAVSSTNWGFVVAWYGRNGTSMKNDIFARMFDINGNSIGNTFLVNTYQHDHQDRVHVSGLYDDNFLVTWISENQEGVEYGDNTYGQLFDDSGNMIGKEFLITSKVIGRNGYTGYIVPYNSGFFVVFSECNNAESCKKCFGKKYNSSGYEIEQFLLDSIEQAPVYCQMERLNNETYLVFSRKNDGSSYGIFGKILTPNKCPFIIVSNVEIYEKDSNIITINMLSSYDEDDEDINIVYNIQNMNGGTFENIDFPGIQIFSFTQEDIKNSKIVYIDDGTTITPFCQISVTDSYCESSIRNLNIIYYPNDCPYIFHNKITINSNELRNSISKEMLFANDGDDDDIDIIFTIKDLKGGVFENSDNPGISITTFTQEDVVKDKITFLFDNTEQVIYGEICVNDSFCQSNWESLNFGFDRDWRVGYVTLSVFIGCFCFFIVIVIGVVGYILYTKVNKNVKEIKIIEMELSDISTSFLEVENMINEINCKLNTHTIFGNNLENLEKKVGESNEIYFNKLLKKVRQQQQEGDNNNENVLSTEDLKELKNDLIRIGSVVLDIKKRSVENEDLKVRIVEIEKKQHMLTCEYAKKHKLLFEREYIQSFIELSSFFRRVQLKLTELFLACKAIDSGIVERKTDKVNDLISLGNKTTKGIISIGGTLLNFVPGIGFVCKGLEIGSELVSKGVEKIYNTNAENTIKKISLLTSSLQEIDKLVESVARKLTLMYEEQLKCLTVRENDIDGGAEVLAESAVGRILDGFRSCKFIYEDNEKIEDIISKLVDFVFFSGIDEKSLFRKRIVKTKVGGTKWTSKGVFQRSGIKFIDDKCGETYYYRGYIQKGKEKRCTRPDKYGYRLGHENEIKLLRLGKFEEREENDMITKYSKTSFISPKIDD